MGRMAYSQEFLHKTSPHYCVMCIVVHLLKKYGWEIEHYGMEETFPENIIDRLLENELDPVCLACRALPDLKISKNGVHYYIDLKTLKSMHTYINFVGFIMNKQRNHPVLYMMYRIPDDKFKCFKLDELPQDKFQHILYYKKHRQMPPEMEADMKVHLPNVRRIVRYGKPRQFTSGECCIKMYDGTFEQFEDLHPFLKRMGITTTELTS